MMSIPVILLAGLLLSASPDGFDSLLTAQKERAGIYGSSPLFALQEDSSLTAEERSDLRFLVAYMSLSDLAMVDGKDLLADIRTTHQANRQLSWGNQVDSTLYRHFVLPHRVSQEPYVHSWRQRFFSELYPRVKDLSMTKASLEVVHWTHEYATFATSDGRDQDPLTTIRKGLGRCEEEMILTICALRAVNIPARQCYTPYWAHCDNNHAWVEVWADGKWHHIGGCEPSPTLNNAWFTQAGQRAMLVISTAYGKYLGNETPFRFLPRNTLINSTGVYGPTTERQFTLLGSNGKPVPKGKLFFNLLNYGFINPAAMLEADSNGVCTITCGTGDWFVTAGDSTSGVLVRSSPKDKQVTLRLAPTNKLENILRLDYTPPPAPPVYKDTLPPDTTFTVCLAMEDSTRLSAVWSIWAKENGVKLAPSDPQKPDSLLIRIAAKVSGLPFAIVQDKLTKASGNWGVLFRFLTGEYPNTRMSESDFTANSASARGLLLNTLTDKELWTVSLENLTHHYRYTTIDNPLSNPSEFDRIQAMDSTERERYVTYVVSPRIEDEPSYEWRTDLIAFFKAHPELTLSAEDSALIGWIRRTARVEESFDQLGAPLPANRILALMRGHRRDFERLYIGLCRVRGIPARFNPATELLERFNNESGKWGEVVLIPVEKKGEQASKTGQLTITLTSKDSTEINSLYYQDWGVQKWVNGRFAPIFLGYKTKHSELTFPIDLPEGLYCLTTGLRRKDGSAPVRLEWFTITEGKLTTVPLKFLKQ